MWNIFLVRPPHWLCCSCSCISSPRLHKNHPIWQSSCATVQVTSSTRELSSTQTAALITSPPGCPLVFPPPKIKRQWDWCWWCSCVILLFARNYFNRKLLLIKPKQKSRSLPRLSVGKYSKTKLQRNWWWWWWWWCWCKYCVKRLP